MSFSFSCGESPTRSLEAGCQSIPPRLQSLSDSKLQPPPEPVQCSAALNSTDSCFWYLFVIRQQTNTKGIPVHLWCQMKPKPPDLMHQNWVNPGIDLNSESEFEDLTVYTVHPSVLLKLLSVTQDIDCKPTNNWFGRDSVLESIMLARRLPSQMSLVFVWRQQPVELADQLIVDQLVHKELVVGHFLCFTFPATICGPISKISYFQLISGA